MKKKKNGTSKLRRMDAQVAHYYAAIERMAVENAKLQAGTTKLAAEMPKFQAETAKLITENRWHVAVVASGVASALILATATITKLFFRSGFAFTARQGWLGVCGHIHLG